MFSVLRRVDCRVLVVNSAAVQVQGRHTLFGDSASIVFFLRLKFASTGRCRILRTQMGLALSSLLRSVTAITSLLQSVTEALPPWFAAWA